MCSPYQDQLLEKTKRALISYDVIDAQSLVLSHYKVNIDKYIFLMLFIVYW